MKTDFDFDRIGRREPYRVPDGFFDTLEDRIVARAKASEQRRVPRWRLWLTGVASAAAVAVVLIVVSVGIPQQNFAATRTATIEDVEKSFDVLSEADRDYLIDAYLQDPFINNENYYNETDY